MNICCYDWLNKQDGRTIAEQDKIKQESQIENDGMRKDRVRGVASQMVNKLDIQNGIKEKALNLLEAHRLINMG